MLELIPVGGLCNKMRAIDSAVSFCAEYDIPLKIYWKKDKKLINCKFHDLFKPVKNLRLYEVNSLPFKFRIRQQNLFYLPNPLRALISTKNYFTEFEIRDFNKQGGDFKELYDEHKHLVMFCFVRFFSSLKKYEMFKPVSIVDQMVKRETQPFNELTIGMHVRRTDHELSITKSRLELFEKIIEEEILKNSKVNFYVASDCSDTKKQLVKKYGNMIHTNFEKGDRTTLQGMYRGITELYALAKATKIYGSFGSSYSGTACELAGVERIQVE